MPEYDVTTKFLIEHYAADWLRLAGVAVGRGPVRVVDADLATLSAAADKVVRVGAGRRAVVVNVDFQVGRDRWLDDRILLYYAALRKRHRLPVRSVVYALRPSAVPPAVTGRVADAGDGRTRIDFHYHLIRAFALTPAEVFAHGVGTLPLAGVSAVARDEVTDVLREVRRRLDVEVAPPEAEELWTATGILLGLRYTGPAATALIGKVKSMRESTVYQHILNQGRVEGVAEGRVEGRVEGEVTGERRLLIRLGTEKFGPAGRRTVARIEAIDDADELDRLGIRLLTVRSWDELLGGG